MISNEDIAKQLRLFSEYLEMDNVAFKPRAYQRAAESIEALDQDISDEYKKKGRDVFKDIEGVGAGIADRIEEYLKTERIKDLDNLRKKFPIDIETISRIEGVGLKMARKLYEKLDIKTIDDLESAAKKGKIKNIEGFGEKSEKNILKGIEFLKKSSGRFVLGLVEPLVKDIERRLVYLKEVDKVVVAGSYRRRKETIGDVDILAISERPKKVIDFFVGMKEVIHVYAHGETKGAVKLKNGCDVDLRVVPKESFGAALNYFTGSKDHNVALRTLAVKKGYSLNEYGLKKGKHIIAGKDEQEIYNALGIKQYIPPELREMHGEIEAAKKGELPMLIDYGSLKGDLQVQTNWTDGAHSIEQMADAAKKAGLSYILITDHTKSLAMTGGQDEKKLLKQWSYIDGLNKKGLGIAILKGAEVNIMKDGSLDIADEVLAQGDIIGIAVHSLFNMSRKDMTARIKKAMSNKHVDILFHPTGRVINKREAYEVDMDEIIKHAKKTKTVLEIDAYPERLDLKDEHIKKAIQEGVKLSIDTDAHHMSHFQYLDLGVAQARRGWATKKDIINAFTLEKLFTFLK